MKIIFVIGALLMLSACASSRGDNRPEEKPDAAISTGTVKRLPSKSNASVLPVAEYMAKQEKQLTDTLAGSSIKISRQRNSLTLSLSGSGVFDANSYLLKEMTVTELKKLAPILRYYDKTRINVVGYTDNTGKPSTNQRLSEKRAGSVADVLIKAGVPQIRFWIDGKGASVPLASNETEAGREQNNRIEIILTPTIR